MAGHARPAQSLRGALGLPPGHGPLSRGGAHPGDAPRAPPGRRAARHAAAARAPARLHARPPRASAQELPFREDFYEARGIEVHATDRGGRGHLPRPRPARRLPDHGRRRRPCATCARWKTRSSPRSRRRACRPARAHEEGTDYTGVWVQERKIASIGVHVSRGVTTHGFAVNVDNDLEPFSWVVACGLPDVDDDLARARGGARGGARGIACFRKRMAYAFCGPTAAASGSSPPQRLGHRRGRAPHRRASGRAPRPIPARSRPCPRERHALTREPRRHGRAERARRGRAPAARAQAAVVQGARRPAASATAS